MTRLQKTALTLTLIAGLLAAFPRSGAAQLKSRFDMHELKPGMLTREIILHAHAKLDTTIWGGEKGMSTITFRGSYLADSGEYRVETEAGLVAKITFKSILRTPEENKRAFDRALATFRRLHGKPAEEYENTFHIVTYQAPNELIRFTTADKGTYYSVALSNPGGVSQTGR